MTPEMLQDRPVQRCIEATERVFTVIVEKHISSESPSDFRKSIVRDLSIFSGFKTYHHLKETAEQVFRGDGSIKAWGEFLKDTSKIFEKYNKNWLRAEYQLATSSAQMAEKWQKIIEQKDRYDLVYSTAGDNQVRPDHAILDGTCLPADDPAWATIYPPNGWGCRCSVHQVIKGSHPYSDSQQAIKQMEEMTKGKEEMFRFNPGIEGRIFSEKHPYYGKRGYSHCWAGKLAGELGKNEECKILNNLLEAQSIQEAEKTILNWAKENQGLHKATTTKTGKILISKKSVKRFLYHAISKEDKSIIIDIVAHNENLSFIREDQLGENKNMSNSKDIKNIERKKKRGVESYTVYKYENEKGVWKVGFERTNLGESPYYIYLTRKKRSK